MHSQYPSNNGHMDVGNCVWLFPQARSRSDTSLGKLVGELLTGLWLYVWGLDCEWLIPAPIFSVVMQKKGHVSI